MPSSVTRQGPNAPEYCKLPYPALCGAENPFPGPKEESPPGCNGEGDTGGSIRYFTREMLLNASRFFPGDHLRRQRWPYWARHCQSKAMVPPDGTGVLLAFIPLLMTAALCAGGCSSIEGRRIGEARSGETKAVNVGGMPIVIQRPRFAVFVATRTTFALARISVDANGNVSTAPLDDAVDVHVTEKPVLLGPSELYAIDIKRPAAGTVDYSIELENYYPKKIGAKLDDQTLTQLRQLALDLLKQITPFVSPDVQKESGTSIARTQKSASVSLVIFDLETGEVRIQDI